MERDANFPLAIYGMSRALHGPLAKEFVYFSLSIAEQPEGFLDAAAGNILVCCDFTVSLSVFPIYSRIIVRECGRDLQLANQRRR